MIHHLLLKDKRVRDFFEGKTIAKLEGPCVNTVTFRFTDGTSIAIETEPTSCGIDAMVACEPCASVQQNGGTAS